MTLSLVHEHIESDQSDIGLLKIKSSITHIDHSPNVFKNSPIMHFVKQNKKENREKITFSKLFLYAPHMFYARFIKDHGYKDGLFRIPPRHWVCLYGTYYLLVTPIYEMIVPVVVLFKTPQKTIDCLLSDFTTIGIPKKDIIFIDNTKNNKGFAHGANRGIKQALKRKPTTILLVNPDVRFTKIEKGDILAAQTKFSIFGGVIKDKSKIYYGGEIDRWYMSGGMRENKNQKNNFPLLILFQVRLWGYHRRA